MDRKVLITGATGDTGRAAVKESIKRGLNVRAMVHRKDDRSAALEKLGAEVVVGDLHTIDEIRQAMEGMDAAYLLPLFLEKGILRLPVGKGRHAPIGAEDQGRVIAAILQSPAGHAGQTYPLFGPVEMDHDQMAAELTEALGRKIVFQNCSIDDYSKSLKAMGVPAYVIQHLEGAMDDYQHGVMAGMNDNVERLTGQKPMSVGEFARAHVDQLNPKVSKQ